ncbi:MAG: site-specific DNA-methyltransferase, partial [Desulfobacteraceae bacterium]
MLTTHKVYYHNSRKMQEIANESVNLVVTSPPYPMIEMWDQIFVNQNKKIGHRLKIHDGPAAFELMHRELDKVWKELFRVLSPGGILCINIGDATRNVNSHFALYTNHARILSAMQKIGFTPLPIILWRKQTNAPNKFMGSGMLPAGAYVTLEHEYILILRKGNKREFYTQKEKQLRRESAFFWEERNHWFSDVWMDLKGTTQNLFAPKTRERSAAFPFELPYRLITMFSVKGDMVIDPFLGIGTTMYAAMAAGRNSVGYEVDMHLAEQFQAKLPEIKTYSNQRMTKRLQNHLQFIKERSNQKGTPKYMNRHYCFPIVTNQEKEMILNGVQSLRKLDSTAFEVIYDE